MTRTREQIIQLMRDCLAQSDSVMNYDAWEAFYDQAQEDKTEEAEHGDPVGHLVSVYQVLRPDCPDAAGALFDDDEEPHYERVIQAARELRARLPSPEQIATIREAAELIDWIGPDRKSELLVDRLRAIADQIEKGQVSGG